MDTINVIEPGLQTAVQDNGRIGYQQYGVSVSGAMDRFAHRIANSLVGNEEYAAVLEAVLMGPHLEFLHDTLIAVTGADLSPSINNNPIALWKSHYIRRGDRLSFGAVKCGCRAYIAVAGGLDVPAVMGSKSTYIKGSVGGVQGRALKAGDRLKAGLYNENLHLMKDKTLSSQYVPVYQKCVDIRVVMGPQDDHFTPEGIKAFLTEKYKVTQQFDRMGIRLDGKAIEHLHGADIISDGIALGAIQVPGQGQPIIMMADRQTIGGYTKIANIITVDLDKAAQVKPGDVMQFKAVTIDEAQTLLREHETQMRHIQSQLEKETVISESAYRIVVEGTSFEVKVEEIETTT